MSLANKINFGLLEARLGFRHEMAVCLNLKSQSIFSQYRQIIKQHIVFVLVCRGTVNVSLWMDKVFICFRHHT